MPLDDSDEAWITRGSQLPAPTATAAGTATADGHETLHVHHINNLPTPILHGIFGHLGPRELCAVSATCALWRGLNQDAAANAQWRQFFTSRWRVLDGSGEDVCWQTKYGSKMKQVRQQADHGADEGAGLVTSSCKPGSCWRQQFPASCQQQSASNTEHRSQSCRGWPCTEYTRAEAPTPSTLCVSVCLPAWPLLLLTRARAGRASMRVTTCGVTRLVSRHSSCCPHRGCCSQVRTDIGGGHRVGTQPTNGHQMQQQQPAAAAARYTQCCPCCQHLLVPTGCDKTQGLLLAFQVDSSRPAPLLSSCHALPYVLPCPALPARCPRLPGPHHPAVGPDVRHAAVNQPPTWRHSARRRAGQHTRGVRWVGGWVLQALGCRVRGEGISLSGRCAPPSSCAEHTHAHSMRSPSQTRMAATPPPRQSADLFPSAPRLPGCLRCV